jgi:hypothetical protein
VAFAVFICFSSPALRFPLRHRRARVLLFADFAYGSLLMATHIGLSIEMNAIEMPL